MTEKKKHTAETRGATKEPESSLSPPGVPMMPVGDRFEYEEQMNELPDDERDLAIEVTRLADTSRYFAENDMQIPPHISRDIAGSRKLSVPERVKRVREINDELMEYLHSVSENSEFRM